jgi:hypothetical protein
MAQRVPFFGTPRNLGTNFDRQMEPGKTEQAFWGEEESPGEEETQGGSALPGKRPYYPSSEEHTPYQGRRGERDVTPDARADELAQEMEELRASLRVKEQELALIRRSSRLSFAEPQGATLAPGAGGSAPERRGNPGVNPRARIARGQEPWNSSPVPRPGPIVSGGGVPGGSLRNGITWASCSGGSPLNWATRVQRRKELESLLEEEAEEAPRYPYPTHRAEKGEAPETVHLPRVNRGYPYAVKQYFREEQRLGYQPPIQQNSGGTWERLLLRVGRSRGFRSASKAQRELRISKPYTGDARRAAAWRNSC